MSRFMKRGYKQNRMRHIWKEIKQIFEIAENDTEIANMLDCLYYSDASKDVEGMQEFQRIVKAVGACR